METEDILERLDALLRDERAAIIRFDTGTIDRCTDEKLTLLAELREGGAPTPALAPRFAALRDGLRHNLALLSYGRACLREVITTATQGGAERPGLCLSVTG